MNHRHSVEERQSGPFHVLRLGGQFPGVPLDLSGVNVVGVDGGILRWEHAGQLEAEEDCSTQPTEKG